jgi:hypothetical protein
MRAPEKRMLPLTLAKKSPERKKPIAIAARIVRMR